MNYGKGAALGQVVTGTAGYPGGEFVARDSEVQAQMAEISSQIRSLEEMTGALESRLSIVCRCPPCEVANKASQPEQVLVQHAGVLRDFSRQIRASNERLQFMLSNLEL